jgi:hypothetical protein
MEIITDEIAFDGNFDYEEKNSRDNGNHYGQENPKNPHYQPDTQVPFDDGVWVLVLFAVVFFFLKLKNKL